MEKANKWMISNEKRKEKYSLDDKGWKERGLGNGRSSPDVMVMNTSIHGVNLFVCLFL